MYGNPNRIFLMPPNPVPPQLTLPLTSITFLHPPLDKAYSSLRLLSSENLRHQSHLNQLMRYITAPINREYRLELVQITCQRDNLSDDSFSIDYFTNLLNTRGQSPFHASCAVSSSVLIPPFYHFSFAACYDIRCNLTVSLALREMAVMSLCSLRE